MGSITQSMNRYINVNLPLIHFVQTKRITLYVCFYSSDTFAFSSSNMKRSLWKGLQVQICVNKKMILKSWWRWWKSYLLSLLMMISMMFAGSDSLSWLQPRPPGFLPASTWGGWDFLHQTFASEEKHQTILTWGDQETFLQQNTFSSNILNLAKSLLVTIDSARKMNSCWGHEPSVHKIKAWSSL